MNQKDKEDKDDHFIDRLTMALIRANPILIIGAALTIWSFSNWWNWSEEDSELFEYGSYEENLVYFLVSLLFLAIGVFSLVKHLAKKPKN